MNEKRVEKLSDLLSVREIQRAIERNPVNGSATLLHAEKRFNSPDTFQVHRPNLHDVARLLALQNTITTSTRHASNIEKLRAVDHMVVLASCNANPVRFDLKAKTAFVFPEGSRHPWLHSRRRDLAGCVKRALKLLPRPRCCCLLYTSDAADE